jgi:alpha-1,3-mannosyl-glycoprotein beta-1,2-N-acetylglucosaminyltransferase
MRVAPDFFSYFAALSPLFDSDPELYCISAWNDNGQERFVSDPQALRRTDCFPGLGWMLPRRLWNELGGSRWAEGFWDDWMRQVKQRGTRTCIFPEVNRAYTFGKEGASG